MIAKAYGFDLINKPKNPPTVVTSSVLTHCENPAGYRVDREDRHLDPKEGNPCGLSPPEPDTGGEERQEPINGRSQDLYKGVSRDLPRSAES